MPESDVSQYADRRQNRLIPATILGLSLLAAACSGKGEHEPAPTTSMSVPGSSSTTSVPIESQVNKKVLSVSSMNQSKDRECNQRSPEWITQWVSEVKQLGATHVGLETTYDDPDCHNPAYHDASITYTKTWLDVIRKAGLNVVHRHMFTYYEGIYSTPKRPGSDWAKLIADYITAHPDFFKPADVFIPMAEPSNEGVKGVTGCPENQCMFPDKSSFNTEMRKIIASSKQAIAKIGLADRILFAGINTDGFAFAGLQNPDHEPIPGSPLLDAETIRDAGVVALDHYPPDNGSMARDLGVIRRPDKFPNTPIFIAESGPINATDPVTTTDKTMRAFGSDVQILGVQHWQGGPSDGKEPLFRNDQLSHTPLYSAVQKAYTDPSYGLSS